MKAALRKAEEKTVKQASLYDQISQFAPEFASQDELRNSCVRDLEKLAGKRNMSLEELIRFADQGDWTIEKREILRLAALASIRP
jgi:hypothetical protein